MSLAIALACLPVLGLLALALGRYRLTHPLVYAATALVCAVLAGVAIAHLTGLAPVKAVTLPLGLPWSPAHFRLDSLSAFFLVILNLPSAMASLYAVAYRSHVPEHRRVTPVFPLFLFGMNLVLVADDSFSFLVAWEFMSVSSWLLVMSDHRNAAAREAGFLYLVMASFGTFCLLSAFALLAGGAGHFSFDAMRAARPSGVAGELIVILALLGAGSKAGLIPLHAWLPLAHPAAPSHVSALMSGVMTKVALYGLIRILMDLHGRVDWWWALVLMGVGAATAAMGVLYALMQTDLKRLLAYSTVENVGIITIALGLAIAFVAHGDKGLGALALVAALYHIMNHATFKTLLFLSAGSVIAGGGSRDINQLGGLLKRLPVTGACLLVGCAAASALPPLNGFVSEWMIFQSLFKGPSLPHWAMKFGVPAVGALMALAAALGAACFLRLFGVSMLGRPRSSGAAQAQEAALPMRAAVILLAALCVILGVFPVTVTTALSHVAEPLTGWTLPPSADLGWPWLSPVDSLHGSYSGTVLMGVSILMFSATVWLVHRLGTKALRRAPAWDCGHPEDIVDAQYSGDSFAQPLRRVYGSTLFSAKEEVSMPDPGQTGPARLTVSLQDPIWKWIYEPIGRAVNAIADRVNHIQYLSIQQYLLMMFCCLILMLVVVAVRQ